MTSKAYASLYEPFANLFRAGAPSERDQPEMRQSPNSFARLGKKFEHKRNGVEELCVAGLECEDEKGGGEWELGSWVEEKGPGRV